jgi:hypothetical protein
MCWLVSSSWCRDSVSCLCAKPFGLPFAVIYSLSLFPLKPVRHSDNRCLRVHLWCASILPEDSRQHHACVLHPCHFLCTLHKPHREASGVLKGAQPTCMALG